MNISNIIKFAPSPVITFDYDVVKHCNLNCAYCSHFAPCSDEWFADIVVFKKNMARLTEVFNGVAGTISLMGGEATLHPDITLFMEVARKEFPNAYVNLISNGLNLPKMGADFWAGCKDYYIALHVTEYPVKFDYDLVKDLCAGHGVKYKPMNVGAKSMFKPVIDLEGKQHPVKSFAECHLANACITLEESGNLYTCAFAANIGIFNKYFGRNIAETETDSINIFDDVSAQEIMQFLASPIPMCRYCDIKNRGHNTPFKLSKRHISEWTNLPP
jgi:sulfatase maturation enzyme AslB (radical SAM superfamily)